MICSSTRQQQKGICQSSIPRACWFFPANSVKIIKLVFLLPYFVQQEDKSENLSELS